MSERTVCDFQRGTGWKARKSNNRGSTSTARRLERHKIMQVRGLRCSENYVSKRMSMLMSSFLQMTSCSELMCW